MVRMDLAGHAYLAARMKRRGCSCSSLVSASVRVRGGIANGLNVSRVLRIQALYNDSKKRMSRNPCASSSSVP